MCRFTMIRCYSLTIFLTIFFPAVKICKEFSRDARNKAALVWSWVGVSDCLTAQTYFQIV